MCRAVGPTRLIAVIQARTGSTRLPGKVLRNLGGRPVLAWVVAAAMDSGVCDEVIVATTTDPADDAVVALATDLGATAVRGPVEDVLTRFLLAIEAAGAGAADGVIRLTADCPLLDPGLIARCAAAFAPEIVDYVTTDHDHSVPHGFDVEIVAVEALHRIAAIATGADRAHVTSYIAAHPDDFCVETVGLEPPGADLRVTLDEPADAALLDAVVAELGQDANNAHAVMKLLRARPDLVALNAHVAVKPLAAG